ncbi:hypothetical protein R1sor_014461 [Riccia sorocarpa]|uniref:Kinesin motor domain-containing protein n=1 Tax=Riccia sorocarpa TaxID=122646 RepID=A0ABD3HCG9_9MARC
MSGCERNYDFGDLINCASGLNRLAALEFGKEGLQLGGKHVKQETIWGKLHPRPPGVNELNLANFAKLETDSDIIEALMTGLKEAQSCLIKLNMAPHSHVRDQTWWRTPWVKEKESEIFGKTQIMEETIQEMDEENLEDSGVDLSTDLWDITSPSNMHADVDEEDVGDDLSFIGHETQHVMTEVLNNALSGEPECHVDPMVTHEGNRIYKASLVSLLVGHQLMRWTRPFWADIYLCVFGPEANTRDVYEAHTRKVISLTIQGFNGKLTRDSSREFVLRVSYMEIYNEDIKDLLIPDNRKLQIHGSTERGIFVAGLSEKTVESAEHALHLMEIGEANHHFGETSMNVHSSRSHTVFRMVIKSKARNENISSDREFWQETDPIRVSNLCFHLMFNLLGASCWLCTLLIDMCPLLNLVDLAGSERVNKTRAEGARLKEGRHINKSLMALRNVIKELSDGVVKQG